ncbi:hypothetical protein [Gynuella sp.]|uniref:hypothetical protein n=1 Tax=Gynuella sp. TaxID=2969146 RepID=UPI003D0A316B
MQHGQILVGLMVGISSFGYSASQSGGQWQLEAGPMVVDQSELITTSAVSMHADLYYYANSSANYTISDQGTSEDTYSLGMYVGVNYSFSALDIGATFYHFGEATVEQNRGLDRYWGSYYKELSATGRLNLSGIGLYVRKPFHITDSLIFSPKLGLLFWQASTDIRVTLDEGSDDRHTWDDSSTEDGKDLYANASLSYMFTDRIGVNADFTHFTLDGYSANSVGLGIVIRSN